MKTPLPEMNPCRFVVKRVMKRGRERIRITLPEGKTVEISPDEHILVINDEPKYIVKDAKDVIYCIREYANKHAMRRFSVNDITQNRRAIGPSGEQIHDGHVLCLTITHYIPSP